MGGHRGRPPAYETDGIRWPVTLPGGGGQPLLQAGVKYVVTYRVGMQKRDREAVMTFVGLHEARGVGRHISYWSARPVAGTQELPVDSVSKIKEAPRESQIYIGKVL